MTAPFTLLDRLPTPGEHRRLAEAVGWSHAFDWYFYIQDLAVLPAYQGRGIGSGLLGRLLDYVARTAPATTFVGLFATGAAMALYQREGFASGDMPGMFRLVESTNN
jgi:GNAT superfamily N-acetyltransferase